MLAGLIALLDREGPLDDVLGAALPQAAEAIGMASAAVFAVGPGSAARLLSVCGPTRRRGYPYLDLSLNDPFVREALDSGVAWRSGDRGRVSLPQALRDVCPRRSRTVIVAPARCAGLLSGVVVFAAPDAGAPDLEASALLSGFATCLGMTLANAALRQRSNMSEAVLDTAGAVARAVSGSLDLTTTFRQVAVSAASVMGDCRCLVLELDSESKDLVAVAASDADDETLIGLRVQFDDDTHAGHALGEGRAFLVEDLVWGARTPEALRRRLSMGSGLFVPIQSEHGPIGSLLLLSQGRRGAYSTEDVGVAESLAEQAASAIINARLYRDLERGELRAQTLLQRIADLRGRQRMTLAGVIHDEIVQTAVAALYELQSLLGEAQEAEAPSLSRACGLLRETIDRARRMIRELRPPVLDGLGLLGSLQELVDQVQSPGPPSLQMTVVGEAGIDSLNPVLSTAIYVVAREAVRNSVRHASAQSVRVSLSHLPCPPGGSSVVRLEVVDDGVGFEPGSAVRVDHFGLRMMEEQMAMVGGCFEISSREDGGGTRVRASAPFGHA